MTNSKVIGRIKNGCRKVKRQYSFSTIPLRKIMPNETILIAGSGRSGTTWLGNIIGACPRLGVIFEPFDRRKVPEAGDLPLRPYLNPRNYYPKWEPFVRKVLSGRIHNAWIDQDNHRIFISGYLIKAIRANLMLAWIDKTFNCRIVYIIRHPCAVVLSRMKLGRDTHLDEFTNQPELMKNHLDPFMSIINGAKTPLQQHAVMWCIENLIPLLQLDSHNWIFSTYEELCVNTEKEIKKVLTNLRLKNTSQVRKTMKRPFQTRSGSAITNSKDVVLDWQNHLSKEEIAEILDIVSKFNIRIYGEGPMPTYNHNK